MGVKPSGFLDRDPRPFDVARCREHEHASLICPRRGTKSAVSHGVLRCIEALARSCRFVGFTLSALSPWPAAGLWRRLYSTRRQETVSGGRQRPSAVLNGLRLQLRLLNRERQCRLHQPHARRRPPRAGR